MARVRRDLGAIAVGVATAGVLVGHWLAYGIESPNAAARARMLAQTGHSYLHLANEIGLALGLVALASLAIGELASPTTPRSFGWFATRLAAVQMSTFVAMEVAERLVAHAPLATLFHGGLLFLGLALQVIVATAGAAFLRWLHRTAGALRTLLGSAQLAPPSPAFVLSSDARLRPPRPRIRTVAARAPPPSI